MKELFGFWPVLALWDTSPVIVKLFHTVVSWLNHISIFLQRQASIQVFVIALVLYPFAYSSTSVIRSMNIAKMFGAVTSCLCIHLASQLCPLIARPVPAGESRSSARSLSKHLSRDHRGLTICSVTWKSWVPVSGVKYLHSVRSLKT